MKPNFSPVDESMTFLRKKSMVWLLQNWQNEIASQISEIQSMMNSAEKSDGLIPTRKT